MSKIVEVNEKIAEKKNDNCSMISKKNLRFYFSPKYFDPPLPFLQDISFPWTVLFVFSVTFI